MGVSGAYVGKTGSLQSNEAVNTATNRATLIDTQKETEFEEFAKKLIERYIKILFYSQKDIEMTMTYEKAKELNLTPEKIKSSKLFTANLDDNKQNITFKITEEGIKQLKSFCDKVIISVQKFEEMSEQETNKMLNEA